MNELTFKTREGEIQTISSREVAKMMEREHKEIMWMIDGNEKRGIVGIKPIIEQSAELHFTNYFIESTYNDRGRKLRCYECTKMGCELLASKMTGEKGILFTAKYVKRFNEMENQLHQITDEQLKAKLLLDIYNGGENGIIASKQLAELEKKPLLEKIEEDKPKVSAYERFINSDFTYTATALKGIFGFSSAVAMNKKLNELKLIYKPGNSKKWTAYKDTPKEWYKVLATEFGDTLKWTSKGILGIAKLLDIELSEEDIENLVDNDNKNN